MIISHTVSSEINNIRLTKPSTLFFIYNSIKFDRLKWLPESITSCWHAPKHGHPNLNITTAIFIRKYSQFALN